MQLRRRNCLLAAVLGVGLLGLRAAEAGTFALVATHPDAAAQPTATGRTLMTLAPFNGKLYAGFGNYDTNDGPIGVRPFNPTTNVFGSRRLNSGTEAIYLYRLINGKLYAPHTDPLAGESNGGYAVGTASGSTENWADRFPVTAVHMYDIVTRDGSDLWMAGSQGNNAALWRSTDGGTSWSIQQSQTPQVSSFVRYYGIGQLNGNLYVQKHDSGSVSRVFDGTTWTSGPNLMPTGGYFWQPDTFAGQMIYMASHWSSALYRFDGTSVAIAHNPEVVIDTGGGTGNGGGSTGGGGSTVARGIHDYAIADGRLYALGIDEVVRFTTDLTTWHDLAQAPDVARSLAILNGELFIGGTDSSIYRYSGSIVPEPHFAGVAAILLLLQTRPRRRTAG